MLIWIKFRAIRSETNLICPNLNVILGFLVILKHMLTHKTKKKKNEVRNVKTGRAIGHLGMLDDFPCWDPCFLLTILWIFIDEVRRAKTGRAIGHTSSWSWWSYCNFKGMYYLSWFCLSIAHQVSLNFLCLLLTCLFTGDAISWITRI